MSIYGGIMNNYLSDEDRKDQQKIFEAVDYAVAKYGKAILDCGHETDGSIIGLVPLEGGIHIAVCDDCFSKIASKMEDGMEVEDIVVEYSKMEEGEDGTIIVYTKKLREYHRKGNKNENYDNNNNKSDKIISESEKI